MSLSLQRLLHSARVYTVTALEVAVLGGSTDLMSADADTARSASRDAEAPAAPGSAGTGRHRTAVPGVSGVSEASEALR
ncbi:MULTISPECIES: hypothetical protein [unclassified Streptomyces]|uniref:hypothetical protein n=1 Tax=unclassified Streptomyces TaxID=2593676 RepID=UPI00382DB835